MVVRRVTGRSLHRTNALGIVERDPPAGVVVDLMMAGIDGFEFISRLQHTAAGRHVPIIVWTVKDLDAGDRRRLRSSAAIVPKRAVVRRVSSTNCAGWSL